MKIAIIIHRLTFKGGTQRQALELAQSLKKMGHEPVLYAFECDPVNTYTELLDGLRVVTLPSEYDPKRVEPFWGGLTRPSYLAWWFKRNRWSRRLAHMIDPDTDILNPHAFYVYAVSYYFKKDIRDVPAIWMLNTMTLRSWKFWRAKELDSSFRVQFLKRLFYRAMDAIELYRFIKPHDITVLNRINKEYIRQWMGKDATVVPLGGNAAQFTHREREPVGRREIQLLMVGSFYEHRRFEDAIEALYLLLKRGYHARLLSIGAWERMDYYEKLRELVRNLGLEDRVIFKGVVSEDELRSSYRESDIGVFPSTLHPGNLATFEMMACGAPTIVSRGAATSALLTHGETALLVPPKSPEAIADSVASLVDDGDLYRKLSTQGRKFVEENISWDKYAKEMVRIFQSKI